MEGWGGPLGDWRFGAIEGRATIAHTPRYGQVGEVYELEGGRAYLILKIGAIDQIVTPDNRNAVDAYVEVSYDGTSRKTRTLKASLNPSWDEEIAVPLRFPSLRDIAYTDIQKKGKIYLDVWGAGTNYVDHLGECTLYLQEIFFNEKNQKKSQVQKERLIL
ncbi:C2 domain-containing protein, putative [Eimeria brunetti]|uniref:C2 domain-containing protein, putative n=1 Tax=Eimeria brunetti TaxID=51314 RepID=U6LEH9_9EIME|nr:C2 domain-containing protein, putative [Eimeria brunetti]